MTYTPDANELSQSWSKRDAEQDEYPTRKRVWGTFSVWHNLKEMSQGLSPVIQSHCTLTLKDSGLIVAYDEDGNAEIFNPAPGWYMNFVPDRPSDEGE